MSLGGWWHDTRRSCWRSTTTTRVAKKWPTTTLLIKIPFHCDSRNTRLIGSAFEFQNDSIREMSKVSTNGQQHFQNLFTAPQQLYTSSSPSSFGYCSLCCTSILALNCMSQFVWSHCHWPEAITAAVTVSLAFPTPRQRCLRGWSGYKCTNNYLITKDFDLTVRPMVDLGVTGILEGVNLQMKWQTLKIKEQRCWWLIMLMEALSHIDINPLMEGLQTGYYDWRSIHATFEILFISHNKLTIVRLSMRVFIHT